MVLSYISHETGPGMSDQLGEGVPSETAQAWDSARRAREPVAWTLLVLTVIGVLVGAWQLFSLPGAPVITVPGPVPATTFGLRASAVAPQFVAAGIVTLPVVSVILVAFAGGLTDRARQVVQTAVSIQAVTAGLGVLSWLGALGARPRVRPGIWFVSYATYLAVAAAALVFTVAVIRSQAMRQLTPQFKDFGEDDEDFGEDA
jgi:hypothetical protein